MCGGAGLSLRRQRFHLERCRDSCLPHPDEHLILLVKGEVLGGNALGFQILQEGIIHLKFAFECPLGHATSLARRARA